MQNRQNANKTKCKNSKMQTGQKCKCNKMQIRQNANTTKCDKMQRSIITSNV